MEQKIAIVTGASSGLGEAMTWSLLTKNYLVYGGSRTESSINHPNFIDMELDVRSESSVGAFYKELAKETEVVDLLVNNAGICEFATLQETGSKTFADHFATNTLGSFHMLKGFEPFIIEEESYIINILSTASIAPYAGTGAYTAAESAKRGFLEVVEKEWEKYRLRFTNLILGAVNTPLWDDYDDVEREEMLSNDQVLEAFNFLINSSTESKVSQLVLQSKSGFLK